MPGWNCSNDYKYIEQYLKMRKDPQTIEKYKHQEIRLKYSQIKNNYDEKSTWYGKLLRSIIANDPRLQRKYQKPSMRVLCDVVDMGDDYDKIYGSLSLSVHGSSTISHLFINKGNFTAAPNFNHKLIHTDASLAVNYANIVLSTLLSSVSQNAAEKMNEYSTWLYYAILKMSQQKMNFNE